MRSRSLLQLVSFFFAAVAAHAQGPVWLSSWNDAVAAARHENRLLLVDLRRACSGCDPATDALYAKADAHVAIQQQYAPFVLLRTTPTELPGAELKRLRAPLLLVVDPNGEPVATARRPEDLNEFSALLTRFREAGALLVRAAALREQSRDAEADFAQGDALMALENPKAAKTYFGRAAEKFRRAGDAQHEENAELYAAFCDYIIPQVRQGQRNGPTSRQIGARTKLERIARFSRHVENAAEAWLLIGGIARLNAAPREAVASFRRAYEMAPAGSYASKSALAALQQLDDTPVPSKAAGSADALLRIVIPPRPNLIGDIDVDVEAAEIVARVTLTLDDAPVAQLGKRPFRATIDLGRMARTRTLTATGFRADGTKVASVTTVLNDRVESFRVAIVAPAGDTARGTTLVEADVRVPPGRTLAALDLYWKDARIASFTGSPYRTTFVVPEEFGYFRAVATLDDGTSIEATRTLNAGGFGENVRVEATTVIVTVVDRQGVRISGLGPADFSITEDGQPVDLTLRRMADSPVTIGLAVDVSRSMRAVQLDVIEIASMLIDSATAGGDRMFLTAFGASPMLLHPLSSSAPSLRRAVTAIAPSGSTAVYDGISFALQQFQELDGRKALVVITDGMEVSSRQGVSACERLAKEYGVPIYVVMPQWRGRQPRKFGNALEPIASMTGGMAFFGPEREELPAIFARILDETRGQYLLSFVSKSAKATGTWRPITVSVSRPDATPRTVSGYYSR